MITLDLSEAIRGCERIQRRLAAIEHVMDHAGDLMKHWRVLMEEGNLNGVLAGTDKDGNPMIPVTYRPRFAAPTTAGPANRQNSQSRSDSASMRGQSAATSLTSDRRRAAGTTT